MSSSGATDWIPAIAMLSAGIIVGVLLIRQAIVASRKGASRSGPAGEIDLELRDLEAKRDSLIGQLQELEETSSKETPQQLVADRARLELEAARVLMAIDDDRANLSKAAAAGPKAEVPAAPSGVRGFAFGVVTTAVIAGVLFFVMSSAKPRSDGAPVSGSPGMEQAQSGGDPRAQAQADVARLREEVLKNPENLDARLDLAYLSLMLHDMSTVKEQSGYVLSKVPGHPRALSYAALVKLSEGDSNGAVEMLKQALKSDPNLVEGWIHLALVYNEMGRKDDALAAIDEAIRRHPEQKAQLEQFAQQIRGDQGAAPAAAAPGDAATQGGGSVAGTIDIDPSVKLTGNTVLFLIARPAGAGGGAPLAVKKIVTNTFPVPFELGSADSMMGQPLPARFRLEVRADSDGDPMTKAPTDPIGAADSVAAGSKDVEVILKRAQ
jgi:tetratricopeptide (TPR) repeat protein